MFLGTGEASHLFVQVLIGGADMGRVPATASVSRASRAQVGSYVKPGRRALFVHIAVVELDCQVWTTCQPKALRWQGLQSQPR